MQGIKSILTFALILFSTVLWAQTPLPAGAEIDQSRLNNLILAEVNALRKKVDAAPLYAETLLKPAANDHALYMGANNKLTHFQKAKVKKTPKNRVDFYGAQFPNVGENVQVTNLALCGEKKTKKQEEAPVTYESLAKALVLNWKNSPLHYKNMVDPDFKTTYTSVNIGPDGKVYACQLLGSVPYIKPEIIQKEYPYKPQKDCKCKRTRKKTPLGMGIFMREDSTLAFYSADGRRAKRGIRNPWRDGMAVDIILKNQYPCNGDNNFNGKNAVRGIPLEPVFKKDFSKHGGYVNKHKYSMIVLGKLPSWVKGEYELNLIVINKRRTCQNIRFDLLPVDFSLHFPMEFNLDTLSQNMVSIHTDTLSKRIYYDKAIATAADSSVASIIHMLNQNKAKITSINVKGFSSIEGTTAVNEQLYKKRAQVLVDNLAPFNVDSVKVNISAKENFEAFRNDVQKTSFEYLAKLTDEELKNKLTDNTLVQKLEPILKAHRYAELILITKREEKINFTKEITLERLQHYVDKNKIAEAKKLQSVEFKLALKGDITLEELNNTTIALERKNLDLLNNCAVMKYYMDSANTTAIENLKSDLAALYLIDSSNKTISTNLAMLDYKKQINGELKELRKYYTKLERKKNIFPNTKAQMLLNLCAQYDWQLYYSPGSPARKRYLYYNSKRFIKDAKLSAEQTFDLAGYYAFFNEEVFSYKLTKDLLSKTDRLQDHIFFLKLIHLTDLVLPRKTYLDIFTKIQRLSGDKFCTIFNSPDLNFQILDDVEIKKIYCKQCAEKTE